MQFQIFKENQPKNSRKIIQIFSLKDGDILGSKETI